MPRLEEAGCTDQDILAHCRSGGEHVRRCWVVDLVLGKLSLNRHAQTRRSRLHRSGHPGSLPVWRRTRPALLGGRSRAGQALAEPTCPYSKKPVAPIRTSWLTAGLEANTSGVVGWSISCWAR